MKDQNIARFWEKYISKTKDYGVKDHLAKWYVHMLKIILSDTQAFVWRHTQRLMLRYIFRKKAEPQSLKTGSVSK